MEAIKKKLTTLRIEVDEANAREQQAREDVVKANEQADRVRQYVICAAAWHPLHALRSHAKSKIVVEYVHLPPLTTH